MTAIQYYGTMRLYSGFGYGSLKGTDMTYNGIAWPGLNMPISVLVAHRGKHARTLKLVNESPKLFNRPTNVKRRCQEAIAQYDVALKVLRDAQKAAEAPGQG